jgi:hypothetical protein
MEPVPKDREHSTRRSVTMDTTISINSEYLILGLLRARKSLTLEQVVALLPELSWNQVFTTVDELSRKGKIILLRRGFQYEVAWTSFKESALVSVG